MATIQNSFEINRTSSAKKPKLRSRVSNGKRAFVEGDGRSLWARRWRDLIEAHIADLGGIDNLSEAQRSLVKRASTIEIELEQTEGKLSLGNSSDLGTYATAASHLRRIFETLGLDRKSRDVTNNAIIDGTAISAWPASPMRHRLASSEGAT